MRLLRSQLNLYFDPRPQMPAPNLKEFHTKSCVSYRTVFLFLFQSFLGTAKAALELSPFTTCCRNISARQGGGNHIKLFVSHFLFLFFSLHLCIYLSLAFLHRNILLLSQDKSGLPGWRSAESAHVQGMVSIVSRPSFSFSWASKNCASSHKENKFGTLQITSD